jgi:hypothetical protein
MITNVLNQTIECVLNPSYAVKTIFLAKGARNSVLWPQTRKRYKTVGFSDSS